MTVRHVESPGGTSRRSIRAFSDDRSVIVTHRKHHERARLEAEVLRTLGTQGAPVPRVLAFDGAWLIQEDLGETRLSQTLARANETEGEALLADALAGLATAQQAGRNARLRFQVRTIGDRADWLHTLATIPAHLSGQLQLPAPALQTDQLIAYLRPPEPAFIKWDARPANAIVRSDASVAWFDWEHCGCRHSLDDVAWLLCDEYTPDWPNTEARLISRFLPSFLDGSSPDAANDYLMTFGALHSCVRLSLILTEKAGGPWWDRQRCLEQDSVGATREMALRLCRRGARWAARGTLSRDLTAWLGNAAIRLETSET